MKGITVRTFANAIDQKVHAGNQQQKLNADGTKRPTTANHFQSTTGAIACQLIQAAIMSPHTPYSSSRSTIGNKNYVPDDLPPSYEEAAYGVSRPSTPAPALQQPWYGNLHHTEDSHSSPYGAGLSDDMDGASTPESYTPQQSPYVPYRSKPVRDPRSLKPQDFDNTLRYPSYPTPATIRQPAPTYASAPSTFQTIPEDYTPFERYAPPPELAAAAAYRDQALSTLSPSYTSGCSSSNSDHFSSTSQHQNVQSSYAPSEIRSGNTAGGDTTGSGLTRIKASNEVSR